MAAVVMVAIAIHVAPAGATATPIHHLVVIFDENISFDHYFGAYPNATNPPGEPPFTPAAGTPAVNGFTPSLLAVNPNGVNPFRIARSDAATCDNNHAYTAEQQAFDGGAMDKFVPFTTCAGNTGVGYFDGNTVTALWNYAQHYALSDNSYGTNFGPSTPGALNLVSGNTHGASPNLANAVINGTVISDPDPLGDQCGNRDAATTINFGNAPNIGTLLSAQNVTWGWFQGGFRPTGADGGGALCDSAHTNVSGGLVRDYSAHHEPFQYYNATRNPTHAAPASAADIGHDDPVAAPVKVNHQYDISDFTTALDTGNTPAVSFLKAPSYEDGHAGYSDPVDEQAWLVNTINRIQASSIWPDTAIMVAYDDSDGWYDHQASTIVNRSDDPSLDQLDGAGHCDGVGSPVAPAGGYSLRCGFGPRLPLLAISPYARVDFVDHTETDQTSILRFIEDNWATGQLGNGSFDNIPAAKPTISGMFDFAAPQADKLVLDASTGNAPGVPNTPVPSPPAPPTPTPPAPTPPAPTPKPIVKIVRRAPRTFAVTASPKRDRSAPYRFSLSGHLTPPAGVARASACKGKVSITVTAGKKTVAKKSATLHSTCKWSLRLTFASRRHLGNGRLTVKTTFAGNTVLLSKRSASLAVRAG
jgi:phospholipase C